MQRIPDEEFAQRIISIQKKLEENDYDAYLVHANETDHGNVRYLSDHWPIFETAGVIIPRQGDPVLLIGPEAEPFARERSRITKIRKLLAYREASEPDYPGMRLPSFRDVFEEISGGEGIQRLAVGDHAIMTLPVYEGVREALGEKGRIIRAEWLISDLRAEKSENEIAMIKEAHRISERAFEDILGLMEPGMTEKKVLGLLTERLYHYGAESEAYPNYVFSGVKTRNAIGQASYETLKEGQLIQLCVGARYGGYASSVGRPVCIGKMPARVRKSVQFGLEAHKETFAWIREGIPAKEVATRYYDFFAAHGYEDNFLYGPCHGCGIGENEKPWIETNSEYLLQSNMTFMADTFFAADDFGFRWEDGIRVTAEGCEVFSNIRHEIIEL